jgi:glycerate kinase
LIPANKEGAGAAGGLGFALMLLGGKVLSGADYVIHASGLKERLAEAEWVVTGEGCSDLQTLEGKLPCKVALAAKEAGVNVALLSGSIDKRVQNELSKYFDMMLEAQSGDIPTEVAMKQAASLLTAAASCLAREIHRNDSVS